jgi:hypothetical protein
MDGRKVGVQDPVGGRFFSSPHHPDQFWGPPSLLANTYFFGALPSWIKVPEHEADHSPETSAKVKNTWIYKFSHTLSWLNA